MGNVSDDKAFVSSFIKGKFQYSKTSMEKFFYEFDKDGDNLWDRAEFRCFLIAVMTGDIFLIDKIKDRIFNCIDSDHDGYISINDFKQLWYGWLPNILSPKSAIVVIDVQVDFISGSLALKNCPAKQDGLEVVSLINNLTKMSCFDCIVYSLDWHPSDHISFIDNIDKRRIKSNIKVSELKVGDKVIFETDHNGDVEQVMWPTHCVQHSEGAQLHSALKIPSESLFIFKGTNPEVDSYSAFYDNNYRFQTELHSELQSRRVNTVFICGLATDFCVAHTATHASQLGYRVYLIEDACRGVSNEGIHNTLQNLKRLNVSIISSTEAVSLAQCINRPFSSCIAEWNKFQALNSGDCVLSI